jgi:hypothetical protein
VQATGYTESFLCAISVSIFFSSIRLYVVLFELHTAIKTRMALEHSNSVKPIVSNI